MEHDIDDLDPSTVALPVIEVLQALMATPEALQPFQVEMLRRHAREPEAEVWALATQALGLRAGAEPLVAAALEEMLLAPLAEVRLRGVRALETLAAHHPEPVIGFVRESLNGDVADPVLAEAVLAVLPHLDRGEALEMLERALCDEREAVRAAAVASLAAWPERPTVGWTELARDPSPLVRAGLAQVLIPVDTFGEAADAWHALATSEEPYVRAFVADALRAAGDGNPDPLLEALTHDAAPLVRAAATGLLPTGATGATAPSAFSRLQDLERSLDDVPAHALETLAALLEQGDALDTLQALSHLARSRALAALCRALGVLAETTNERPTERLARACTALEEGGIDEATTGFGRFAHASLHALRAPDVAHIVAWGALERAKPMVEMSAAAALGLALLDGVATCLEQGRLADALLTLEEGAPQVQRESRPPERMISLMVIERWTELLENEIEQTVAGVSS